MTVSLFRFGLGMAIAFAVLGAIIYFVVWAQARFVRGPVAGAAEALGLRLDRLGGTAEGELDDVAVRIVPAPNGRMPAYRVEIVVTSLTGLGEELTSSVAPEGEAAPVVNAVRAMMDRLRRRGRAVDEPREEPAARADE